MLEVGIKGYQERMVDETVTASSYGSGLLPVFSTPAMIALIEGTAWQSVQVELKEGWGTVGTKLDVEHVSATPIGMKVWCETKLTGIDGRRLVFHADVYDDCGLIGTGTHERFIIEDERFMKRAEEKKSRVEGTEKEPK